MFEFGIVEGRSDDPLLNCRLQVRVYNVHTFDKTKLPTKDLPWYMTLGSITSANVSGIGTSNNGIVLGATVCLVFLDEHKQHALVIGTVPGIPTDKSTIVGVSGNDVGFKDPEGVYPKFLNEPDTNRLARNMDVDKTIVKAKETNRKKGVPQANGETWEEPESPYASKYPFNKVTETESGHVFEVDDTPDAERIHQYHKSGTYEEVDKNGRLVRRIVGDSYEIIDRNGYVSISGKLNLSVNGETNIFVGNDANIQVDGSVVAKIGNDLTAQVSGAADISANENIRVFSKKDILFESIGKFAIRAKDIAVEALSSFSSKSSRTNIESTGAMDIKSSGVMNVDYSRGNFGAGASGAESVSSIGLDAPEAKKSPSKVNLEKQQSSKRGAESKIDSNLLGE